MSQQLISRSPDLKRLRDEGYDVEVRSGYLLVKGVPYVNAAREVRRGVLASTLDLAGDVTTRPSTHVAYFVGEHPCHKDGSPIQQIAYAGGAWPLGDGLVAQHAFSNKPPAGYPDFHAKMTRYADVISHPAQALDPGATARTFPVVPPDPDAGEVFVYLDTATSRAGTGAVSRKLEGQTVAIVGLGGTGSYVLDLVAKTPVRAIHLFDGDKFSQHNAFRSPGAASIEELRAEPQKAHHFQAQYARMHRHVVAHDGYLTEANVDALRGMTFVFLCVDNGDARRLLVGKLEEYGIPFVDVGMGVYQASGSLGGVLRVTSSTPAQRGHVARGHRIPFAGDDGNNEYARNIQIADLNALNAVLAVVKWKKLLGFYLDLENEHHSTYTIDGNVLTNEDRS